ncbi:hypothetical protein L915_19597, partial [Phytophthora nicotianae]
HYILPAVLYSDFVLAPAETTQYIRHRLEEGRQESAR